jgi:hypothetical protein
MKSISARDLARVADYLEQANDPRRTAYGNIRHKLVDIIVTAFTELLCGCEDYEEMEEFGRLRLDFLKGFLELPDRISDEPAFRRVFWRLNPLELQKGLENQLVDIKMRTKGESEKARLVNIDGKTIRGSGFHAASAQVGERGLRWGGLRRKRRAMKSKRRPSCLICWT